MNGRNPDRNKQKGIEVLCCYARPDQQLLYELIKHLTPLKREGIITIWADIDIGAGTEWEREIHHHLDTAQIILLLISPDFIASDYCYSVEMQRAMKRHKHGEALVIPIILRPVSWQKTPVGKLQALPTNANPVMSGKWHHQDEAFYEVVEGLRRAIEVFRVTDIRQVRLAQETPQQGRTLTFEQQRLAQEVSQQRSAMTPEQLRLAQEAQQRSAMSPEQLRLTREGDQADVAQALDIFEAFKDLFE